jgi:RNA polymerase sigma-70 factor (sigma-E family)
MTVDEEQFAQFVRSSSPGLTRTAWLLTGDWASAEDLVQTALLRTWQRWNSVSRPAAEAYTRRVVMTTFLGWRRRRWIGEVAVGWLPDRAHPRDLAADVVEHNAVMSALLQLPRQQRAVIVLRYFDDFSEQAIADALGCGIGTVKTHASRGLHALRSNPDLQAAIPTRTQ